MTPTALPGPASDISCLSMRQRSAGGGTKDMRHCSLMQNLKSVFYGCQVCEFRFVLRHICSDVAAGVSVNRPRCVKCSHVSKSESSSFTIVHLPDICFFYGFGLIFLFCEDYALGDNSVSHNGLMMCSGSTMKP